MLQNNADKSAAALVDYAFQRLAQLCLSVCRHTLQLCLQVLSYDLMEAAAEDVGLPQLSCIALEFLQQIVYHVL